MKKYLNLTGLDHLVSKLKGYFIKNPASGSEGQYLRLGSNNEITWSSLPLMLTYKGDVPTVANLPQVDNEIGDVWYITTTSEEYFWKEDNGTYSWELLGLPTYGPATTSQVGVVKPDGTTITVDNDGTIHSAGGGTTYTAGDHITITSNVISAKTSYIDNAEYELDTFYSTDTTFGDCRFVFYTSELENYITITDPDTLQSETCLYRGHLLKMELYNLLDLKWEDIPDPYGIAYRTFYLTTLSNTSKIYIVAGTEVEPLFDALNILTSYTRTGTASGELCLASDIKALLGVKENLIHAISPIHLERSVADGTLLGLDYDNNTLTKVNNKLSVSTSILADWNSTSGRSEILNKPTLATVATSGSYNDLIDKPTIPASQVQSDWAQVTTSAVDYIKNKPTTISGYGITDAKIENGVITLGSNSITPVTTVGNGTLNIQVDNGSVATICLFGANLSANRDITLILGSNITLTPDTSTKSVTIAATDTTYTANNSTVSVNNTTHKIQANGYIRPHDSEVMEITDSNISYDETAYIAEHPSGYTEVVYCADVPGEGGVTPGLRLVSKRYNIFADINSISLSLSYYDIFNSKESLWEGVKTYHYIVIPKKDGTATVNLYNGLDPESVSRSSHLGSIFLNNSADWTLTNGNLPYHYTGNTNESIEVIITFVAVPTDPTDQSTLSGYYTLVRLLHK